LGIRLVTGPGYLQGLERPFDAVFLTPGIDRRQPQIARLRRDGTWVSSETGLFFRLCRAPIIGITGSSGKTTTTSMVGEILKTGPRPVWVGGNIGNPLIEHVSDITPDSWVVLELSSFQLEFLNQSPHI